MKSSNFVESFCSTVGSSVPSLAVSDSEGPFNEEFEEEEEAVVLEFDGVDEDEDDEVEEAEAEDDDEDEDEDEEEEEEEEEGAEEEEEEVLVEGPFSLSSDFNCASHVCRPLSVGNSLLTTTMTLSELLVIISMTCRFMCNQVMLCYVMICYVMVCNLRYVMLCQVRLDQGRYCGTQQ